MTYERVIAGLGGIFTWEQSGGWLILQKHVIPIDSYLIQVESVNTSFNNTLQFHCNTW